jgi:hypothetical protein
VRLNGDPHKSRANLIPDTNPYIRLVHLLQYSQASVAFCDAPPCPLHVICHLKLLKDQFNLSISLPALVKMVITRSRSRLALATLPQSPLKRPHPQNEAEDIVPQKKDDRKQTTIIAITAIDSKIESSNSIL